MPVAMPNLTYVTSVAEIDKVNPKKRNNARKKAKILFI